MRTYSFAICLNPSKPEFYSRLGTALLSTGLLIQQASSTAPKKAITICYGYAVTIPDSDKEMMKKAPIEIANLVEKAISDAGIKYYMAVVMGYDGSFILHSNIDPIFGATEIIEDNRLLEVD